MRNPSLRRPFHLHSPDLGFSLIEVLISVLVLALGMLGVAAMQATALRNSQSALERSQGVIQTYSIVDSMRANRSAAAINEYNLVNWTCAVPDETSLATQDLAAWINGLKNTLGQNACARINCVSGNCLIEVRWDDSRGSGDTAELQEYVVQTRSQI